MDQIIAKKIFDIQERVLFNPETEQLSRAYKYYCKRLRESMEYMTEEQRDAVLGYVGAMAEIYAAMLELAVQ